MTDEEISRLLALCEAAPEDPECVRSGGVEMHPFARKFYDVGRTALPDLIARVRSLEAEREELRTLLKYDPYEAEETIDRLTAKLNEAQTRAQHLDSDMRHYDVIADAWKERAERAEAELAEIKRSRG